MKKNRIFGLASVIALLAAGACSNDTLDAGSKNGPNEAENADGAYLAVTFDLPSAKETRSFTEGPNESNSGTEVGHDYENTVADAYIVLATTDNAFIAAERTMTLDKVGASGISYRSTAVFQKTALGEFYDKINPDADGKYFVNVFVFANPTDALDTDLSHRNFGDTDWVNALGVYDESLNPPVGVIWTKDYFLMANSSICKREFPSSIDEWSAFNTSNVPFNLSGMNNFGRPNEVDNLTSRGNILVERAAARYDFRDGALDGINNEDKSYNGFKAQTYHVVLDKDENPLVDVFLGKMSMVNMNKEYYYLRRVSTNGLTGEYLLNGQPNEVTLLGQELPWYDNAEGHEIDGGGNYVVDAFADWKYSGNNAAPTFGFANHFNYPFFNEEGVMDNAETSADSWYTSIIKDVLDNGASDSWISGDVSEEGKGKYKTWRYLTEGTIPGIQSQKNAVSNGIVFKGQLQPAREAVTTDDEFTQKLLNALKTSDDGNKLRDPILYVFGGHVYCTWDHIRRMAIALSLTELKWNGPENKWDFKINRSTLIYNAVFGTGGFDEVTFSCDKTGNLENANFLTTSGTLETLKDNLAEDVNSANYKHSDWKKEFPTDDDFVEENEAEEFALFDTFRKAAVDAKIALYQTSYDEKLGGWGYYCYYYYWNRHNDNGQVGEMGPMEFAVVRNNVYKLAVTKIARLGHPRISANDPEKPTPDTPDEKGDVYITVTCTTLPWVVRENNIEF